MRKEEQPMKKIIFGRGDSSGRKGSIDSRTSLDRSGSISSSSNYLSSSGAIGGGERERGDRGGLGAPGISTIAEPADPSAGIETMSTNSSTTANSLNSPHGGNAAGTGSSSSSSGNTAGPATTLAANKANQNMAIRDKHDRTAPQVDDIAAQDDHLVFSSFTATTAWTVGCLLRSKLLQMSSKPAVVSITHANSDHLLFHAVTRDGTHPDNDEWVSRKRRTVLRFGRSTWYMRHKFDGDEGAFAAKYGMNSVEAGKYAIHGGGFPVKIRGCDGVVGVIVVSGLQQWEDHQAIVDTLQRFLYDQDRDYESS